MRKQQIIRLSLFILMALLPLSYISAQAKLSNLQSFLNKLQENPNLKNSAISFQLKKVENSEIIAELNPNMNLVPASVMKLINTSAALISLGENYRFKTEILHDGFITKDSVLKGNIYIKGYGDPTFCTPRWKTTQQEAIFQNWTKSLKAKGINKIEGEIIADISLFQKEQVSPLWQWSDVGNTYGAGASAINFNSNQIEIFLKSDSKIGDTTKIDSIFPFPYGLNIVNNVRIEKIGSGNNSMAYVNHFDGNFFLEGSIPVSSKQTILKAALPKPEFVFISYLDEFFNANGIKTENKLSVLHEEEDIEASSKRVLISTHYSPSLTYIIPLINRFSNNIYAEALFKSLGLKHFKTASYETGSSAVQMLIRRLNIGVEEVIIADGSGLSRNNAVNAAFFCNLLEHMIKSKHKDIFYYSMSEAGKSGTLRNMFRKRAVAQRPIVYAKSGSMQGVRTYAGYIYNSKKEILTFAAIVNNYKCKGEDIRDIVEELLILASKTE